jgi:hypothetical protein
LAALGTSAALGLGVVVWFAGAGGGTGPETASVREYEQSFKGGWGIPANFDLFGPEAERHVKFDPDGLRITLPPGSNGDGQGIGLGSTFGVKGDFEITVGFEILQEVPPADPKAQTRFTVAVPLDRPGFNIATLSHRVQAAGGTQFLAWVSLWDEQAGNSRSKGRGFSTPAKGGRLRLARTGSTLSYSGSAGPDAEFVVFQQFPFGDEDLQAVRLIGATDDAQGALDVRVTDFHVRAESLPNLPAAAPPKDGSQGWLVAAALLGLVIALPLLVALGLQLYAGRGRGAGKPPVDAPVPPPRARPAAAGPPLSVTCPSCGKTFKARAELAGKRVKCPQCRQAVAVPAIKRGEPGRAPP